MATLIVKDKLGQTFNVSKNKQKQKEEVERLGELTVHDIMTLVLL